MTAGTADVAAVGMVEGWAVIVPVKAAAKGKSRLTVPGADRAALARAIALDTIAAVAACPLVARTIVVTDDGALALYGADIPGLRFVDEGDANGLNEAIALGAENAGDRMPRAALLADLPALRPADLAAALTVAASFDRSVVADAEGAGSTLVTMRPDIEWETSFGEGSFARHLALGCVPLEIADASTLRRDVDTADHLDAARALGLGPRTARVLAGVPAPATAPATTEADTAHRRS